MAEKKVVEDMTLAEFEAVPAIETFFSDEIPAFNFIVLLPTSEMYDNRYPVMNYVLVDEECYPIGRLARDNDCLELSNRQKKGWSGYWMIDCLPKSKLLRVHRGVQGKMSVDLISGLTSICAE